MSKTLDKPLPPGSVIGILGGGQLGRMAALAAARLGYRCHAYGPEADAPANQVCAAATVAPYDDEAALTRFAESVEVFSDGSEVVDTFDLGYEMQFAAAFVQLE